MRVVFMGTSVFAVPSLKKIKESGHDIITVISQPDKAQGRGKKVGPQIVKKIALDMGLDVYQPDKIKSEEAVAAIRAWNPEIIVVAAYGQIIPRAVLEIPRWGCLNVHASLLPAYRGAAPIQRAIMAGERISGVTIMQMDEGLDTGDILAQQEIPILDEYDHGTLEAIMAEAGAQLLIQVISELENGVIKRVKQDDSNSSYAAMLTKEDELIKWQESSQIIYNKIRALSPVPGAYTQLEDQKIKIFKSRVLAEHLDGQPGQILKLTKQGLVVKTGDGLLEVLEVQKEGKKRITAADFVRGYPQICGKVFV